MTREIIVNRNKISQGMEEVERTLSNFNVSKDTLIKSMLAIEDVVVKMFENSGEDTLLIKFRSVFDMVSLRIKCRGEEFSVQDLVEDFGIDDVELRDFVNQYMARIMGDNISIYNRSGINNCKINISKSKYLALFKILAGLVLGLLVGWLLELCLPSTIVAGISDNILSSISTLFLNAIKMVVAPLVLFSMASSVADFSDLAALGKIAIKVISGYILTSIIAIGVGLGVYNLFPIGDSSLSSLVTNQAAETIARGKDVSISIKDLIVNIIPSDSINPLLNSDMLQIIFIGVILGIAISGISNIHPKAKDAVICLNDIFSKITTMIIGFMPLAVFCSMAKMVIDLDMNSFAKVAAWLPVSFIGFFIMIVMYSILLFVFTRLNPFKFLKAYFPVIATAFSLASSNATMPYSMKCCDEKLGIPKKLYSFSIPLGATINMDGSCITMIVTCLFMAKIFGITLTTSSLISLIIAIIAFSIGAPGIPGSVLVGLSLLLPQIGVPAESISIILGIYSINCMGQTAVNVCGDGVVTTIVASLEKMLDIEKYNSN